MKSHYSPKQVAQALGVSESSVKRWCDQGLIPVERTAGGHRRIPVSGVVRFTREHEHSLVEPELLNLPPAGSGTRLGVAAALDEATEALEAGDEDRFRAVGFRLYLDGHSIAEICDRVLAPSFHRLGDVWQHGRLEVYQERRGCEICLKLLHELRLALEAPEDDAPLALGGTLHGDWYALPTTMCEIALREAGWQAHSLGSNHPAETLVAAIRDHRPRLFWISVSFVEEGADLTERIGAVYEAAVEAGTALALGGRVLEGELRRQVSCSVVCEDLRRLVSFAAALEPAPHAGPAKTNERSR